MKYLAMTSTALFLLMTPGMALAQTTTDDSTLGTGAGVGAADTNPPNATGGENQCSDETATSSYNSFSEKCRHQLDAWAMSQAGASTKFDGDIVVGTPVPDTVEIVEVPAYHNYGYVMLNDRRVLVDRTTHKVVRVY